MKLRISINVRRIEGPYGGVNHFANTLDDHLSERGHTVLRDLGPGLDVILIASSKPDPTTTSFPPQAAAAYRSHNPEVLIVQRINTCDEARGADLGLNEALLEANRLADYTVFVSAFIRDLFIGHGFDGSRPHSVILNGAEERIFHPEGGAEWDGKEKLRVATHHWSSNYLKGFDIYERLDQLLSLDPYKDLFSFSYIGNIPLGVAFRNTTVYGCLHGLDLAHALRQHHLYVTAARLEAGGNHHIEAMRSGLPVLYLESGSLPEYCSPFGIGFHLYDFESKLMEARSRYGELRRAVLSCPYTGARMAEQYEELFLSLVRDRCRGPSGTHRCRKRYALWPMRDFIGRQKTRALSLIRKAVKRGRCAAGVRVSRRVDRRER